MISYCRLKAGWKQFSNRWWKAKRSQHTNALKKQTFYVRILAAAGMVKTAVAKSIRKECDTVNYREISNEISKIK